MGNYSDQPDYATSAYNYVYSAGWGSNLNGSAIYVGDDVSITVIMPNDVPNYANAVQFKGLKQGMFTPIIVDYILGVNVANPRYIQIGKSYASVAATGVRPGTYTVEAPITAVSGGAANGIVKFKAIITTNDTIDLLEVIEHSTNHISLVNGAYKFTLPAGSMGGLSVDFNNNIGDGSTVLRSFVATDLSAKSIVTFK